MIANWIARLILMAVAAVVVLGGGYLVYGVFSDEPFPFWQWATGLFAGWAISAERDLAKRASS